MDLENLNKQAIPNDTIITQISLNEKNENVVSKSVIKSETPEVKKAVSFEKVCERIEKIALKDNPDFTLTNDMKKEIKSILDNGVKKCEYYLSPSNNYTLMSKTSFRKGRFVADRNGNGVVSVKNKSGLSNGKSPYTSSVET